MYTQGAVNRFPRSCASLFAPSPAYPAIWHWVRPLIPHTLAPHLPQITHLSEPDSSTGDPSASRRYLDAIYLSAIKPDAAFPSANNVDPDRPGPESLRYWMINIDDGTEAHQIVHDILEPESRRITEKTPDPILVSIECGGVPPGLLPNIVCVNYVDDLEQPVCAEWWHVATLTVCASTVAVWMLWELR